MFEEFDKRIWGFFFVGCRLIYGLIEVVEYVVEWFVGLDLGNISYYVVLLNLYVKEGRWDDVERVRKLIDEKGMGKMIGYSIF